MTYGFGSYNQTIELETINPLRSSEGGDTKPMVLVVENEADNDDREEVF